MITQNTALFTIFGATGDLAHRKLYPSLFRLYKDSSRIILPLSEQLEREWSDVHFREVVLDSIKDLIEDKEDAISFAAHFYYIAHNVNDAEHYIKLKDLSNLWMPSIYCQGTAFFTWRCLRSFSAPFPAEEQKLLTQDGFNRLIMKTFRAGFRICGWKYEVAQVV